MSASEADVVIWHDIECGAYTADLALWRELAAEAQGPVLDIGAGTGRVSLDLAGRGAGVVALDIDARLLASLAARAATAGLAVVTRCADAVGFDLPGLTFALVIVPMQTVQLLDGPASRAAMLSAARRHLLPGGRLAMALAPGVEPFEASPGMLPEPDVLERDGISYVSQPVAVREVGTVSRLERVRTVSVAGGATRRERDTIDLARLTSDVLVAEGRAEGLILERIVEIPGTDRHVGSEVVILRA